MPGVLKCAVWTLVGVDADQACADAPVSRSVASVAGALVEYSINRVSLKAQCRNDEECEQEIASPLACRADPILAGVNGFCTSPGHHWCKPGSTVSSRVPYHLFGVDSGAGWQEAKMLQAPMQDGPIYPVLESPGASFLQFRLPGLVPLSAGCPVVGGITLFPIPQPFPQLRIVSQGGGESRLEQHQRKHMMETIMVSEMTRRWWNHGPLEDAPGPDSATYIPNCMAP
jgi:hypothetical protein